MTKTSFYLLLGAVLAMWLGGLTSLFGYALCTALFAFAGVAFDVVKHISIGIKAGAAERSSPTPVKPTLRVVK